MKQAPSQNKARIEKSPRHAPLPSLPDARHGPERMKTDHKISPNQHSQKPKPVRAVERETDEHWGRSLTDSGHPWPR